MISLFSPNKDAEDGSCLREHSCKTSNVFLINEHVHGHVCWRLLSYYLTMLKEDKNLECLMFGRGLQNSRRDCQQHNSLVKQPHTAAIIYTSKTYLQNFYLLQSLFLLFWLHLVALSMYCFQSEKKRFYYFHRCMFNIYKLEKVKSVIMCISICVRILWSRSLKVKVTRRQTSVDHSSG